MEIKGSALGEIGGISFGEEIFTTNNKYGYKIFISHPAVAPSLERYKAKVGAGQWPLSHTPRMEFEAYMYGIICDAMQKQKSLTLPIRSE